MEIDFEKALQSKETGNQLYQAEDYGAAIHHYTQGVQYLDWEDADHKQLVAIFHGNLSA
jgi:hypothetical protein